MPALHEFVRLMLPKMVSHPIEPITFLFFTSVATSLSAGSVTAVSFARNFQSVPVSLVGVAFSLGVPGPCPPPGRPATGRVRRLVRTTSATIGALTVLAAIGLVIVGPVAI